MHTLSTKKVWDTTKWWGHLAQILVSKYCSPLHFSSWPDGWFQDWRKEVKQETGVPSCARKQAYVQELWGMSKGHRAICVPNLGPKKKKVKTRWIAQEIIQIKFNINWKFENDWNIYILSKYLLTKLLLTTNRIKVTWQWRILTSTTLSDFSGRQQWNTSDTRTWEDPVRKLASLLCDFTWST